MSLPRSMFLSASLVVVLSLLAACGQGTSTPTPASSAVAGPTATATRAPARVLTACLGQEPASLFPVANPSAAAQSVLAAIYDGPIDTNSYGYQPVILKDLPSLQNGDAQVFSKVVTVGDEVVDANGTPVTLQAGVTIRPAGCTSDACAIKYDGSSSLQMDQMQATFRLLPGLTWSDGEPLTADDSVYAYQVASSPKIQGSKKLVERTQSYEAADATTVQWWGRPGFIDPTYFTNFWAPLPRHLWSQIPFDQLGVADQSAKMPTGWGAYILKEWVPGDHISLVKNPHYFRAAEGLPKFDTLTFRFVSDPAAAVSDLLAGTCDVLDPSVPLDGQVDVLRSMSAQNQLQALFTTLPVMEELALGIKPAAYDNNNPASTTRPDYFSDVRVRQAVAMCLDRQKVVDTVLAGLTNVPKTFVPLEDPLYNADVTAFSFNVTTAGQLLDQAGWKDTDNDPATPRVAAGIAGVRAGTPLELDYVTTSAVQRQQVSSILAASLGQCGIKVNVQYVDPTVLYAIGPQGVLFGRSFDLAEFAMGSSGIAPACDWFTTAAIPDGTNHWVGENVSGYSNPAFDKACQAAGQSLPGEAAQAAGIAEAQSLFAEELPVIPLYWRIKTAAARADMCHFTLDPTAGSALWNIEAFDSGADCGK